MQTVITIATIAFLSSIVVFGFFSVVGDLLDRSCGSSPLLSGKDAPPQTANVKSSIMDTAETITQEMDNEATSNRASELQNEILARVNKKRVAR
jgi:hypothetical protein